MIRRRGRTAARVLGAFALVAAAVLPAAAQEPVFVQQLGLPVATDVIGYPRCVTADLHTGEAFVCDTRKNRILIFEGSGLFVHEITGGDRFAAPRDVAVDPEGFLVVLATHDRRDTLVELDFDGLFVREIRLSGLPEGVVEPVIVSVALSPGGDRLYALDSANLHLWISDRDGEVTGSVDLAAGLDEVQRRNLILGKVDVYDDTVLVALPSSGLIRTFAPDGRPRRQVGKKGSGLCALAFPVAGALAANGELVVVDQQRMLVQRWNRQANRCLGEYIGPGGSPGALYFPMDLSLDGSGRILVSQGFQGRVQLYEGMPAADSPPAPPRPTTPVAP